LENEKYLIFRVDGRSFSLPFADVKVIIAAEKPVPVPDFPEYIPGTVTNEEKVVPVIDLRKRFHYQPKEISDRDCIIITMSDERPVGLLCDGVYGFTELSPESLQPAPNINEEASASFIEGEFLMDETPCYVLSAEKVVKLNDKSVIDNLYRKDM